MATIELGQGQKAIVFKFATVVCEQRSWADRLLSPLVRWFG